MSEPSNTQAGQEPTVNYVTVEIYDQTYHLAGQSVDHIPALAARLDAMMRAVAGSSHRTADSLRVAVLAALNLADELSQAEERLREFTGEEAVRLRERAHSLTGLLDTVLDEAHSSPDAIDSIA